MNDILNRGFVRPYVEFNFANGSIDTPMPKYFVSFHQDRSVEESASFELTLTYVPGMYNEKDALDMHKMILASVNQPVTYTYGYVTPGGGLQLQETYYKGIFTKYTEDLNDGYLTYKIIGVGSSVENITPECNIETFLSGVRKASSKAKPSELVSSAISGVIGIKELFEGFDITDIDHTDEEVDTSTIQIKNGTVRDVFSGSYNADGTQSPTGFAYYSYRNFTPEQALASGMLSKSVARDNSTYNIVNAYASSSLTDGLVEAHKTYEMTRKMPFVCYFDNCVDSKGSPMKGSFHYKEKFTRQVTNTYYYNVGNSFIDSDVLSFSVSVDDTVAMATVSGLNGVSTDIDYTGDLIGSSFNHVQTTGWHKNTYNTISGFNEGAWMTSTVVADALNFPFEATMTVIGQTKLNKLLDKVHVVVMLNGAEHPGLTGDYVILGIEDDVSESGYTTTFRLLRDNGTFKSPQDYLTSASDEVAQRTQETLKNDWK